MAYVVLARKYRPSRFEDFVGQEAIATTLRNAIVGDRVHHAYLFCGPRGVGKTSMARVFSMALNCSKGASAHPCGECGACRAIMAGDDIDVLELDGASNRGIDQVRDIRANLAYAPARSRYKIYYIDEAHMLTIEAFNALLKTLEEPPAHVKFILSTTEPTKMPETIHSRCQRFDFRRISAFDIAERLKQICGTEKIKADDDVVMRMGRHARGSMRDALSLLDQLIAFCGTTITLEHVNRVLGAASEDEIEEMVEAFRVHDPAAALRLGGHLLDAGKEAPDIFDQLAGYLRDLLVAGQCGADVDLLEQPVDLAKRIAERSAAFTPETLMYMLQIVSEARRRARGELDPRLVLEMTLVKLARITDLRPLDDLTTRLEALEQRLGRGGAPAGGGGAAPGPRAAQPLARYEARAEQDPDDLVAAAAPAAPAADGEGDLVHRVSQILLQGGNTLLSSQVANCGLAGRQGDTMMLTLPANGAMLRLALDKPKNHARLEESFSQALGEAVKVAIVGDAEPAGDAVDAVKKHPMVRKAMDALDGRVIDVEVA